MAASTEEAYDAGPFVPEHGGLPALRKAAAQCRGCPLHRDRALQEVGIDPRQTYVTNAVKHFKWQYVSGRGKRRIHKPPTLREMSACGPWLAAELAVTEPQVLVVMGATAGKALFGSSFRVAKARGTLTEREVHGRSEQVLATIHPSAVLRAGERGREAAYGGLVSDLRVAAGALE